MNKKCFIILLMVLPLMSEAQVNISIQLPPAGLVQKEQLWNLTLVNNGADILDITMQLNLQDAATGQVVLTATTGNLLLSKGVKMIRSGDLQPVSYTYNLSDFARSYIPMGNYVACYQVINSGARKETPIAEDCIRFSVDPLSPPLLSSPSDKSIIESPYPQFSWMPPTPFDMFTSLSYDLLVTEVLEGQSSSEAIQNNTPLYEKSSLSQPYESYATSFSKLDTGKVYAWQVVAKNGLNYAAKTEIWTFKIAPPSWIKQLIEQTPYIKMKMDNPEKGVAPNGVLKMSYTNETADTIAIVHLKEVSAVSKGELLFEMKINRGENLLQKDIQKILPAKEGAVYEASIINTRGETWRMLFESRQYKDKKTERN
jgi:hypothetical protein